MMTDDELQAIRARVEADRELCKLDLFDVETWRLEDAIADMDTLLAEVERLRKTLAESLPIIDFEKEAAEFDKRFEEQQQRINHAGRKR